MSSLLPIPFSEKPPLRQRICRNVSWVCMHTDSAILSLGRKLKAKFFPSALSGEEKFLLSFSGDKRFLSPTFPITEQLSAARSLSSGEEAKNALLTKQITYSQAQVIAIEKLETLSQAQAVIDSQLLHHPHSLIALQVRYQQLGGRLERTTNSSL